MSKPETKLLKVEDFTPEEMEQLIEGAKKYMSPPEYMMGKKIDYGKPERIRDNTPSHESDERTVTE